MFAPSRSLLAGVCLLVFSSTVFAQGTAADYERMEGLYRAAQGKVTQTRVEPHWLPDGDRFWYRVDLGDNQNEFILVDATTSTRKAAFDSAKLAQQLGEKLGKEIEPLKLPFRTITFAEDQQSILFDVEKTLYRFELESNTLSTVDPSDKDAAKPAGPSQTRPYPSVDKGGEVSMKIVNSSAEPIKVFWINREGRPQLYDDLKAGGEFTQRTFLGHVWMVLNAKGQALSIYEATDGDNHLVLDGKNAWDMPRRRRGRPSGEGSRRLSPNREWNVAIEDHNLVLLKQGGSERVQLTEGGTDKKFIEGNAYWSPDSKRLLVMETTPGDQREITIVESSPKDQLQPKVHTLSYAKPGDAIRLRRPRLFDIEKMEEIAVDNSLMDNPWAIDRVKWEEDSSEIRLLYNQRGHQVMRYLAIQADGTVRTLIDETTPTFIDWTNKVFLEELPESNELIWMSERSGWNHLYLVDAKSGEVKNPITEGDWVVREVEKVDPEKRQIFFKAGGIVPGQDPYYIHHCRVNFDGTELTMLTEGDGTHRIQYSPDGRYLIDEYSRVDMPAVHTLRKADDGSLVCELEKGDCSQLIETGWKPTERFVAKARDGETDIYGVIYFPTNHDPAKKYPVIEYIYAGPQGAFVPKQFSTGSQLREMAELGFIVVQIDGMGTNYRSKAFHDVCFKNLKDAGFPDRILWMQAAAKKFPSIDLDKVGIYGGSAGGQNATAAVLFHGDFYDAAVSDCGCHDNRMDKIWWNEQWMGWPIDKSYEESSNVVNAHKLKGDLFLIVGEMDTNVDPASTMQVVDALVKANKDFDLLVVPGGGHGSGSSAYGMRRTRDFFVRKLHGVEPRR
ncbi:prolyl oligopeptidase family serine peptidase [Bremerella sp. JC817]|uniref:prolyl oligopeptidase family serine peptidase n=1 Tax=Bremerella sp. JC817 TaxID=3231756 RepID=UPI0034583EC9